MSKTLVGNELNFSMRNQKSRIFLEKLENAVKILEKNLCIVLTYNILVLKILRKNKTP